MKRINPSNEPPKKKGRCESADMKTQGEDQTHEPHSLKQGAGQSIREYRWYSIHLKVGSWMMDKIPCEHVRRRVCDRDQKQAAVGRCGIDSRGCREVKDFEFHTYKVKSVSSSLGQ